MSDNVNTSRPHPNDLPEAHDPTTRQIHEMSDFSLSGALGIPLLAKDTAERPTSSKPTGPRPFATQPGETIGSYFAYFTKQDRLVIAASAAMILGPLLVGALSR